jgi:L-asparaginase II
MEHPPLYVEITRGPAVESRHAVHAVLADGQGKIIESYGDALRPTFPRSCIKPLQAIALVETGAADAYGLSAAELALACASHSGEERHTEAVMAWLARLGLDEEILECGGQAPKHLPGGPARPLCNNCSGKHAGMVTLSLFLKAPPVGYTQPTHPAQRLILETVAEMCGEAISPATCGVDGCSAPNPLLPLASLARGFAAFMNPQGLSPERAAACRRLSAAMTAHPGLVAGVDRIDTVLMEASGGKIVSKVGAEGMHAALVPEKGVAIVFKVEDGAVRAAHGALYALLERHGLADEKTLQAIRPLALPALRNWRGIEVGVVRS